MMMINETSSIKKSCSRMEYSIDETEEDIRAPIANQELDEFLDNYIYDSNTNVNTSENSYYNDNIDSSSLKQSISLCNSLEDLVKTFDKNVKDCLRNYKNIDIGQLAPVQVRAQEEIINDSQ